MAGTSPLPHNIMMCVCCAIVVCVPRQAAPKPHHNHTPNTQPPSMTMRHFLRLLTLIATVLNVTVGACQSCLLDATLSMHTLSNGILGRSSSKLESIDSSVVRYLLLRKLVSVSVDNRLRNRGTDTNKVQLNNKQRWSGGFFIDESINDPDEEVVDVPAEVEVGNDEGVMTSSMIMAIGFYKKWISPILPPACRFLPTCSQYGVQAIKEFGPSKGVILTAWRLARCSPFGGRGYDPPRWPPVAYNYGSY